MAQQGEAGQDQGRSGRADDAALIAVVALPSAMASAVIGVIEALTLANVLGRGVPEAARRLDARVVSLTGETVAAFGGRPLEVAGDIGTAADADAVVVPPIVDDIQQSLRAQPAAIEALHTAWGRGATLAGVCTGSFYVAETGLLDGRRATTNPAYSDVFRTRYPKVELDPTLRLADEGRLLTAGATTSFLDLAIELVARYAGPEVALRAARQLVTGLNPRSQKPFLLPRPQPLHNDEPIRAVQAEIESGYGGHLELADLAKGAGMSPRTLSRRFRDATGETPQQYLQRTRVEAAMRYLESTRLAVDDITSRCGYQDTRSFRRLFREHTGLSPRDYRRQFGYAGRV